MVFGVFPKDFNEIELRAVGWQAAEEGIKFLPPTQGEAVVQSMMNLSIVFPAWKSKKPTSKLVGFSKAWGDIPGSNR